MNKRLLDLLSGLSAVLTFIAATPDNKDIAPLLPVSWQPYVIKAGVLATLLLKVLAYLAKPTPSPLGEAQRVTVTNAKDGTPVITPAPADNNATTKLTP